MSFKIITGNEIGEKEFRDFIELEHSMWPKGSYGYLPESYVRELYHDGFGLFMAYDRDTLAGYLDIVITDHVHMDAYLKKRDFLELKRIDNPQEPVLYLYTANLWPQYRGTSCMLELCKELVNFLDALEKQGMKFGWVVAEAVSEDGARVITRNFELSKMNDVDDHGLGHYEGFDGLREYRKKMRQ